MRDFSAEAAVELELRAPGVKGATLARGHDVTALYLMAFALMSRGEENGASSSPDARDCTAHARPVFDWFEYRGEDALFDALTPLDSQYTNPILQGFHSDPSVLRVSDDFYLVTSSFAYFPGLPIFHSTDLVSWTQIGHVLDRPSQLNLPVGLPSSSGVFAPSLRYHDGVFYVVSTIVGAGGNFLVTADDASGPWSDPIWLSDVSGIDPDLFFDDDGKVYVLTSAPPAGPARYEGHHAIWLREIDLTSGATVGSPAVIVDGGVNPAQKPGWIEGPHLIKRNGSYYLLAAEGGTFLQHSAVVFKSSSPWGPYIPSPVNPILTQRLLDDGRANPVTSVGHADFVQLADGSWWTVFHGCRPYEQEFYNTGRETFLLPVDWSGDFPVVLSGDTAVPYVEARPPLPRAPDPAIPHRGNFVVREAFDGVLSPYWVHLRTPDAPVADFESIPGSLVLHPTASDLASKGKPAFLARRQQHRNGSATARLTYVPARAGDTAGIAAFQSDDHYFALAVTLSGTGYVLQLAKNEAGSRTTVAEVPVTEAVLRAGVSLRVRMAGANYDFEYSTDGTNWDVVAAHQDGRNLSTHRAGGFTGAMLGVFASEGR